MAWSVVQSASGGVTVSAGSPTLTVTFGSTPSAGNKLIAYVTISDVWGTDFPLASCVKDGLGNTLTSVASISGTPNANQGLGVFVLDAPASPSTQVKLTYSGGSSVEVAMLIQEVSGLASGTSASVDGTPGTSQGSATGSIGPPSYTDAASSEYLAYVYGDNGGPLTWTAPGGYTADSHGINSSSSNDIAVAYKNSTGGTETGSWSLSGTPAGWGLALLAFKVAAGGAVNGTVQPAATVQRPRRFWQQARGRLGNSSLAADGSLGNFNAAPGPGTPQPPQYQVLGRTSRFTETYRFSIQPGSG